jgi:hypothetical protein
MGVAPAAGLGSKGRTVPANNRELVNAGGHVTFRDTLGYEQVAIEVTASIAQNEPDPYEINREAGTS